MICIYHSADNDGFCSGAIVKKAHPEAELIGYNYGKPFPWDKIQGQKVIMVDVSLEIPDMSRLAKEALVFTWIDHHEKVIKEYHKASRDMDFNPANHVVLKVGKAACELAWDYFFPDEPMPLVVNLLGIYDTWRKSGDGIYNWNTEIMPFQYGMRLDISSAESFPQNLLDPTLTYDDLIPIFKSGKVILTYQDKQNEIAMKNSFTETIVGGLRAIMCNLGGASSNAFKSVYDPEKHDVMVPFIYVGPLKKYRVSFYSESPDIDCSAIAGKFGGGGHFSAAGCQVDDWKQIIEE